ncbi:MAG: heme-binding protein [Acidobacteria bacterium]|nr:heme-binding protein [Acidobacteriota bacterium]MBV9476740.1 heme-binding protein [Acidobacteriota bacterium]
MRRLAAALLVAGVAWSAEAARVRAVRTGGTPAPVPQAIPVYPEPAGCAVPPVFPGATCSEGSAAFAALRDNEVDAVVRAAAKALDVPMTIAVVDRAGRVLALAHKAGAGSATDDDLAVGVARTAAFFSHDMAPLSSRTVRFLSGVHFPPGITNTPSAALYGIENTNRGCDMNLDFVAGQCLPTARSVNGLPCDSTNASGCGPGIVTGKVFPNDADPSSVNAGGIPLYRVDANGGVVSNGKLVGAIGISGVGGDSQRAEFASVSGAFGSLVTGIAPVPFYPLPDPGNVFIDGVRLPFLGPDLRLTFANDGLPNGVRRLDGTSAGTDATLVYAIAPGFGGCAPNGYLVAPRASSVSALSAVDVDTIVQRAIATAKKTRAVIRLPLNSYARMVIAVADTDGTILALYRMPDATVFSVDVAVAKSRNVVYFSQHGIGSSVPAGTAVSNRTIAFGGQPTFPSGIDSHVFDPREGPWYQSLFVHDLANPCSQGTQPANPNQNGIVFFAGSTPLYRGSTLVGGLGVSGDGIEQDDYVSYYGAGELLPPQSIWADQIVVDGVRLPMFKFPRHPEGVTECGGQPCS